MNRRTLLTAAVSLVVLISLIIGAYLLTEPREVAKPYWLKPGDYITYEQDFTLANHITETKFMTWNITKLHANFADLHLVYYNGTINPSNNSITINANKANWTLNLLNRVITNSSDPSYIGYKCPFWIELNVGIGSTEDSLYGHTTIIRNETINVLGLRRDCWVTEQNSSTFNMTRWYEKSTGIVLRDHVVLHQSGVTIEITETATQTNVASEL
jgi:hypothetical protein